MQIREIDEGSDEEHAWDANVSGGGSLTDLSAWRHVVRATYDLRSHFLAAFENENILGTLGLYEVRHRIFGHYLTTAPFANEGGFHFDNPAARDRLLVRARELADELDVDYLVIRARDQFDDFTVDRHYQTAILDLEGGADAVWSQRLRAKTRNQVRKGMDQGFTVETGHDQLKAFYQVFHQHMRDLGSPGHAYRYYESIINRFGSNADFLVVRDGANLVAGALLFSFEQTAMNYHTVALRQYNSTCSNYLLYWKMIEASCTRGIETFDMGRSIADSPVMAFKRHWGPAIHELSYNYYLRRGTRMPDLDPRNPRFRLPVALWRKLPLPVSKRVGPMLISGLA